MKKLYPIFILLLIAGKTWSQAPEKISYQAVVRDATSALVTNQSIGIQISILETSPSGNAVYVETQSITSNVNGLISLEIGSGTIISGDFSTIDWGNNTHFIQTEIDPTGGTNYTIIGTSQLMSVPYALHSKTADNVTNDQVDDADADPNNEIELPAGGTNGQVLETDGSGNYTWVDQTVDTDTQLDETAVDAFVANNGYVTTSNDADADPNNEIELPAGGTNGQVLETDGSGNYTWVDQTVDTDTQLDETAVDAFVANNGYVTTSNDADADPNNEIELPAGGTNGQVLETDGSGNYTWVDQTVDTDTQLDETAVDAFVANNGYVTTSNDADADPNNEIELPTGGNNGQVLETDGSGNYTWVNQTVDTDTQLDETAVDAFVANNGYVTTSNDADADPNNEIELPTGGNNGQVLETDGSGNYTWVDQTVDTDTQLDETAVDAFVANNGYVTTSNDADADPSNEIQTLSVSGNNLTISGGNTVSLSGGDSDWTVSGNDMYSTPTGNVGLGITSPERKLDVNGDIKAEKIFLGSRVINVVNGVSNTGWNSNSKGIKVVTNIPNDDNQKWHSITITGHHTGGLYPIEIKVSWRNNNGGFTAMAASVTGSAYFAESPTVKINTESGNIVVYVEHTNANYMWYYNLAVDAMFVHYYSQMDRTWYDGWTLSRILTNAPAGATTVPVQTIIHGQLETNELKLGSDGYSGVSHGSTSPTPSGGTGSIIYNGSNFFGWNGSQWRQLDN